MILRRSELLVDFPDLAVMFANIERHLRRQLMKPNHEIESRLRRQLVYPNHGVGRSRTVAGACRSGSTRDMGIPQVRRDCCARQTRGKCIQQINDGWQHRKAYFQSCENQEYGFHYFIADGGGRSDWVNAP